MNKKKIQRHKQQTKNLQQIQKAIRCFFFVCLFLLCVTFNFDTTTFNKTDAVYVYFLFFIWHYKLIWFSTAVLGLLWHVWHLAFLVHWLQHLQLQLKPKTYSQFWAFVYTLLEQKISSRNEQIALLNSDNQSLQIILEQISYPLIELSNFFDNTFDNVFNIENVTVRWCNLATSKLFDIKRRDFYDKKIKFLLEQKEFRIVIIKETDLWTQQLFNRELDTINKKENIAYQSAGKSIIIEKILTNINHQFFILTPVIIAKRWFILIQDLTQHYEQQTHEKIVLSYISHELKTPLAVIQNSMETMNQEALNILPKADSEERIMYDCIMSLMSKETKRMHELIEDLLDFQAINLKNVHNEPILLHQLIEMSIATALCIGRKNTINYQSTVPINIRGSRKEWLSILDNLLQNAQKHTQGTITITVENTLQCIKINIQDQGQGIASEHLPFLFEPFYRIPVENKPQGSGLGLAIVKKLVERQQGSIHVISEIGKGTCFSIIIPYS